MKLTLMPLAHRRDQDSYQPFCFPKGFLVAASLLAMFTLQNASADVVADRLIAKVEAKTRALKSFRYTGTTQLLFAGANGSAPYKRTDVEHSLIARPNKFHITDAHSTAVSDGHEVVSLYGKYFQRESIEPHAENFHWFHNDLYLFYVTGSLNKALTPPTPPSTRMLPDEIWNGNPYKVVQIEVGGGFPISYKLYVGNDNFAHRLVHEENNNVSHRLLDFSISDFEPNPPVRRADFVLKVPSGLESVSDLMKGETPLIKVGQAAVDFSLPMPSGDRIKMSDMLRGKKALLLNFWFIQCPPCRAEHPHLNSLYNELKDKGLGLLAIDDQDAPEHSAKYMKDAKLDFDTVLTGPRFPKDPKTGEVLYRGTMPSDYASLTPYGVHSCPTNIIIGPDGKVAYVGLEWDEKGLRAALASLGVK